MVAIILHSYEQQRVAQPLCTLADICCHPCALAFLTGVCSSVLWFACFVPVDKELAPSIVFVSSLFMSCNVSGLFSNWIALCFSVRFWGVLYPGWTWVLCQICTLQVFLPLCNLSCHLLRKPFSKADVFMMNVVIFVFYGLCFWCQL